MKLRIVFSLIILFSSLNTFSQYLIKDILPILDYNPNARLGGIADIGVVSSVFYKDAGIFQNPALISFNSEFTGSNLFYRSLKDTSGNYSYISGWTGYHAINSSNAFGFNLSYLNYPDFTDTNELNEFIEEFEPYEMFFQLTYTHSFSKIISTGLGVKYIRSNYGFMQKDNYINSFSVDIGLSYHKTYSLSDFSNLKTNAGLAITNFGPRIANPENEKSFIPTKFLLGLFINPDIYLNELFRLNIELAYQAEKYLVPSEPIYHADGDIIDGKDPDITAFNALYQSFYDSPDGFSGEIDEIRNKFGSEFRLNYSNTAFLALRHGRIFELKSFGGGNYQTFGCGIGIYGFMVDYQYIKSDNVILNDDWAITLSARYNMAGKFFRF